MRWPGPSVWVVLVATGMVGMAPLFGGPGYESALATGLVVPSVVAVSSAWRVVRAPCSPIEALAGGASRAAVLGAVAFVVTLLHGLRVGFCSLGSGAFLFALGPWAGAFVAGWWGAIVGLAARARCSPGRAAWWAVAGALAGPVASALVSGVRFLTSPMVFAFDPFVGFFSGTLYDTVIDGTERLVSYRLGSLGTWLAVVGVAAHAGAWRWRGWLSVGTLAAAAVGLGVTLAGPSLGHHHTSDSIRSQLGGRLRGPRCEVIHPRTLKEQDARLFLRDCEQQLDAVSAYFDVEPPQVTAFLFADTAQKRRLMGAAETYIAKPWRREVYLQVAGYPHPVLGHELAHVVAGQMARGPFRVAGALRGLLPDPGLVEGVAVAAAPEDDELSPEAWSRVMLELGLLPPLDSLFSLKFYALDASRAYTVAGAFVAWIRSVHGPAAVRRWYGGEDLPTVVGRPWSSLEAAFREHLRSLPFPGPSLALGRSRFDRPSLFHRRCPHELDARKRDASALLGAGDLRGAEQALDEAAPFAPRDPGIALLRATCAERSGQPERAAGLLEGLLGDGTSRAFRDRAEERLGDLALARGDAAGALARYEAVAARVLDEDHLRTLDIKLLAARDERVRPAIVALLVGSPRSGIDASLAAEELGRWAERAPDDGLPRYLLGRGSLNRGHWERGASLLDEALARGLSSPRVAREAARQRVIAGCMLADQAAVERGLAAWTQAGAPPGNRDALLRGLAARCAR